MIVQKYLSSPVHLPSSELHSQHNLPVSRITFPNKENLGMGYKELNVEIQWEKSIKVETKFWNENFKTHITSSYLTGISSPKSVLVAPLRAMLWGSFELPTGICGIWDLSNMVPKSHKWLLRAWKVACVTEEWPFNFSLAKFYLNSHMVICDWSRNIYFVFFPPLLT